MEAVRRSGAALLILCLMAIAVEACHFSSSCTEISTHGTILYANCRNSAGESFRTSIDVNECIGSHDGELDCSSNFLKECTFDGIFGITLRATCKKYDGSTTVSNRALDECIGNYDGKLQCC